MHRHCALHVASHELDTCANESCDPLPLNSTCPQGVYSPFTFPFPSLPSPSLPFPSLSFPSSPYSHVLISSSITLHYFAQALHPLSHSHPPSHPTPSNSPLTSLQDQSTNQSTNQHVLYMLHLTVDRWVHPNFLRINTVIIKFHIYFSLYPLSYALRSVPSRTVCVYILRM